MLGCLLWNSAIAAIMAACLILVGRCFRLTPATRHAMWLVVLVKLLSPIGLIWSVPLPFDFPLEMSSITEGDEPAALDALEQSGPTPATYFVSDTESEADLAAVRSLRLADAGTKIRWADIKVARTSPPAWAKALQSISLGLLVLWSAGSMVVGWRYLTQTIRFARCARNGKVAGNWLKRPIEELAQKLRVRMPEVRIVPGLTSPVVWCLFRPVLLWPKGLQKHLKEGGREAVLVHELAHLRRGDHLWRWLDLLAAIVHWWNPLYWLARRQMRFQAELACDAWVLGTLPNRRRDYAEALLDVCQRSIRPAAPTPAVGVGGEGKKMLERRLCMIMQETVPHRVAMGARLFVVLLGMAALPAWTLGQAKPEPKAIEKKEIETTLQFDGDIEILFANEEKSAKDLSAELVRALTAQLTQLRVVEEKKKDNPDAKLAEIEAKITELNKLLQMLKAQKAASEKPKEPKKAEAGPTMMWRVKEGDEGHPKLIIMDQNGKQILQGLKVVINPGEPKKEEPKAKTKGEWRLQFGDGQGIIIIEDVKEKKALGTEPKGPVFKIQDLVIGDNVKGKKAHEEAAKGLQFKMDPIVIQLDSLNIDGLQQIRTIRKTAAATSTKEIVLTRRTYKISKEKAAALEAFLKEHLKATILETKMDAEGLTVTTTPETQKAVQSLIELMSGPRQSALQLDIQPKVKP